MEPVMNELTSSSSYQERKQRLSDRKQEAYRVALALYKQNPDWVTYFREILGIGGVGAAFVSRRQRLAGIREVGRAR